MSETIFRINKHLLISLKWRMVIYCCKFFVFLSTQWEINLFPISGFVLTSDIYISIDKTAFERNNGLRRVKTVILTSNPADLTGRSRESFGLVDWLRDLYRASTYMYFTSEGESWWRTSSKPMLYLNSLHGLTSDAVSQCCLSVAWFDPRTGANPKHDAPLPLSPFDYAYCPLFLYSIEYLTKFPETYTRVIAPPPLCHIFLIYVFLYVLGSP